MVTCSYRIDVTFDNKEEKYYWKLLKILLKILLYYWKILKTLLKNSEVILFLCRLLLCLFQQSRWHVQMTKRLLSKQKHNHNINNIYYYYNLYHYNINNPSTRFKLQYMVHFSCVKGKRECALWVFKLPMSMLYIRYKYKSFQMTRNVNIF